MTQAITAQTNFHDVLRAGITCALRSEDPAPLLNEVRVVLRDNAKKPIGSDFGLMVIERTDTDLTLGQIAQHLSFISADDFVTNMLSWNTTDLAAKVRTIDITKAPGIDQSMVTGALLDALDFSYGDPELMPKTPEEIAAARQAARRSGP